MSLRRERFIISEYLRIIRIESVSPPLSILSSSSLSNTPRTTDEGFYIFLRSEKVENLPVYTEDLIKMLEERF